MKDRILQAAAIILMVLFCMFAAENEKHDNISTIHTVQEIAEILGDCNIYKIQHVEKYVETPVIADENNTYIKTVNDSTNEETHPEPAYNEENASESLEENTDILTTEKEEEYKDAYEVQQLPSYTVKDEEAHIMYASGSVNVRSGPSTDYERIGYLSLNSQVEVNGRADTGWYRIKYESAEAYVSDKYLSDTETIINIPNESPVQAQEQAHNGIAEALGNVDPKWVNKANKQLRKAPQNVLDRFTSCGMHLYVTDEDIGTTEFGGSIGKVAGATKYGQYIKIEDRQYAIDEALLHELGHFVFDMNGNWGKESVVNAFNADVCNAASMGITYGLNDCSEFYAEVFQKYLKDSASTSKNFPNLSAVIQSDMSSL